MDPSPKHLQGGRISWSGLKHVVALTGLTRARGTLANAREKKIAMYSNC